MAHTLRNCKESFSLSASKLNRSPSEPLLSGDDLNAAANDAAALTPAAEEEEEQGGGGGGNERGAFCSCLPLGLRSNDAAAAVGMRRRGSPSGIGTTISEATASARENADMLSSNESGST